MLRSDKMSVRTKNKSLYFSLQSPIDTILKVVLYNTGISQETVKLASQVLYNQTIGRL